MGFLSSLDFYRLGPPPIVKLPELADFLRRLAQTGILSAKPYSLTEYELKFGRGIDQDGQTIDDYKAEVLDETDDDPFEFSGEWDLARTGLSCAEMAGLLAGYQFAPKRPTNLYRANLSFGPTQSEIFRSILPPPELQNGYTWRGEYWSFEMGPVLLYSGAADERIRGLSLRLDALVPARSGTSWSTEFHRPQKNGGSKPANRRCDRVMQTNLTCSEHRTIARTDAFPAGDGSVLALRTLR